MKDTSLKSEKPFKGYSMEELRYQRALLAMRKEFSKAKVIESMGALRPGGRRKATSGKSKSSALAIAGQVASKVFSNLNALDYVLMGLSAFGTIKKGYKMIKGK